MAYRWLLLCGGAAVLGMAAWWFGRPVHPAPIVPDAVVVAVAPTAEPAKEPPAPVIDVIDLSRSYEPAPEPVPSKSDIAAAQYIETAKTGRAAYDGRELDRIILTGGVGEMHPNAQPEKIKVEPRVVPPRLLPFGIQMPHDLRHFAEIPWT